MEPRRLGGPGPYYYDHDATDDHSAHVASKHLSLASERSRSPSPATELIRPSSTALPATSELAYHSHHSHHHYHQEHVDTSPALQPLSHPDHRQIRLQHRYQELSPSHYHHHRHQQQHYESSYQHYQHHGHEPRYPHEHELEQPLSPHVRPQIKLQARLLPSVYHSPVTRSPDGSGLSTPRLPPISMLTAAASMQLRAPEPLQREMPVELASQHTQTVVLTTRDRAPAPPASRVHRHGDDEEDNVCRYRNKRCHYPRAIKRNGDRHNLCEKHRAKANQNQRKLESKRRIQKRVPDERTGAGLDAHHRDGASQTHASMSALLNDRALLGASPPLPLPRPSSYTQLYEGAHSSHVPDVFASF